MQSKKIGIVSLGLIGGSIFKCLKNHFENITVVTRNEKTLQEVKRYTSNASDEYSILEDCDVIFVCSPMNKTLEILDTLESIVKPETIVTDVCSLKEFVMQKQRPYVFIGSHPMAGTEHSGYDASFETLFEGAKWVITASENTDETSINILKSIIELTGAKAITANAKEHDEAVALISHMPMLLAQALTRTVKDNKLAQRLASSGFRDMTRLALSNTEMAQDMITMNSQNIFNALLKTIDESRSLIEKDYLTKIKEAKTLRAAMYNSDGKNITD